ncbi:manganese-dependent inorganic pyrophosphatase [Jeotgalibaca porci]|uniref:Probable manganese-dependent inorganic pyrophosphatase n=1 Tax=Jeotgalibaca porci TaxID=1868793 RepID=A0A6G7WEP7_9LACT|nr:manganese-dependent inorganic pyrophosphatase [Jeotgalibaca porci]QIK50764.1 manganese-dependent inorganic pyrophosphatase [Jeotgalibaca porci]
MEKLLVFGHQNPDTDAITSAISFAHYLNESGVEAEAVAFEGPSEETAFALNHFNWEAPRVVNTVSNEVSAVALVDHNEFQQSATDITNVEIKYVIDHHRISNFETANPLYYRSEPVGCTNTVIYKMYQEKGIEIPAQIAGLMLSAIISDTLLFKSPTCTPEDVAVAKELAAIADVDVAEYGMDMLKAGTNLDSKSSEELLDLDAKSFPMGDKSVRIGQVNTVDIQDVLKRQEELVSLMTAENAAENYDLFVLMITNIVESDSTLLVVGNGADKAETAFNVTFENQTAFLEGVVSRKKQIVPQLTEAYTK